MQALTKNFAIALTRGFLLIMERISPQKPGLSNQACQKKGKVQRHFWADFEHALPNTVVQCLYSL